MQGDLFGRPLWRAVIRCDSTARAFADRHYSRQTVGSREFLPPGQTLVLLGANDQAVWAVCHNMDPAGRWQWRCTIFRNESALQSSALARSATVITRDYWTRHYGAEPALPLTTEVDPGATRRKRDPGRCFLRAGWAYRGGTVAAATTARGLVVLVAP